MAFDPGISTAKAPTISEHALHGVLVENRKETHKQRATTDAGARNYVRILITNWYSTCMRVAKLQLCSLDSLVFLSRWRTCSNAACQFAKRRPSKFYGSFFWGFSPQ